jgi:hypothetical protein
MTNPITRIRIRLGLRRFDKLDAERVRMYAAVRSDDRQTALRAARKAARLARQTDQPHEQRRFNRWVQALESGRRIKISTYRAWVTTDGMDPLLSRVLEEIETEGEHL